MNRLRFVSTHPRRRAKSKTGPSDAPSPNRRGRAGEQKTEHFISENQNPCYIFAHSPDRTCGSREIRRQKERRQEFFYFFGCNPLKSPDSDE
jgi:hypothetical protein